MRIKLTLSYDGSDYCGWQIQPNGKTVQELILSAIFDLTGERVTLTGSGRTDAGVHAKAQVAHFDTNANIPPEKFSYALNARLPEDIRIIKSEGVADSFDANRTAKKKTYCYSFYKSDVELPLKERYAVKIDQNVDVEKMRSASKLLLGEHDFKAFSATGGSVKTTVRTVYSVDIIESDGDVKIYVCGGGFLYNMVRIIAGTLLRVGEGKLGEAEIEKMLSTGDRTLGGKTCPAKGLCLEKVEY